MLVNTIPKRMTDMPARMLGVTCSWKRKTPQKTAVIGTTKVTDAPRVAPRELRM